ncbi:PP2C family protein-serine/threonine phosphatase [Butyrivibrio sp. CB08]|uniref:PP2C family protein-serine/threonine phosphatase n=1 Tax=Butyrivibrio sp. CB08 TaxID=2364879 RepID=UPI001314418E|nr:PP2C family serine/threonine-protein phosphatase [Butyrivibrio sp. CB08]
MEVKACIFTDAGKVRKVNQDSCLVKVANTKRYGRISFAAVCDGMGGLSKGEVASCKMIRALEGWFGEELALMQNLPEDKLWDTIETSLMRLIVKTSSDIRRYGRHRGIKLGTTLTAFLQIGRKYMTFNIGDSRIYLVDRKRAMAVTRDQSLVQDKLDKGIIVEADVAADPDRSVLLQSVGTNLEIKPDVSRGEIGSNTTVLAVSDGFWRTLEGDEIHGKLCPQMCVTSDDMLDSCRKLAELAMGRDEDDNISVAAMCLEY